MAVGFAVAVVAWMAWIAAGRLDTAWPSRNLLEWEARENARNLLGDAPADRRLPGSIEGRVVTRSILPPPLAPVADADEALVPPLDRANEAVARPVAPDASATPRAVPTPVVQLVPVVGATVLVVDPDANVIESVTDASGWFALRGLFPGRYRVIASAPGFAPQVIDRPGDGGPVTKLVAWVRPGIEVPENGASHLDIVLDPVHASPVTAFARDVALPDLPSEPVSCDATGGVPGPVAAQLPIRVQGAADAIVSLRRYQAIGPSSTRRPTVVAAVPSGTGEDRCAAIALASRGIEVIVAEMSPDARAEGQIVALRALLGAVRLRRPAPGTDLAGELIGLERGPVLVGAGYAAIHALRAASDEAADVAPPVPLEPFRVDHLRARRARVVTRIGGLVLVAPVVDLFAARRAASAPTLPPSLVAAIRGLGPADREATRYVRWSPRFHVDPALPPVIIARGMPYATALEDAVDAWVRVASSVGVPVDFVSLGDAERDRPGNRRDDATAMADLVDRVATLALTP